MLELYGTKFTSRMLLGTGGYASPDLLRQAVEASGAEIVTVSLRRESARARTGQGFWATKWRSMVSVAAPRKPWSMR